MLNVLAGSFSTIVVFGLLVALVVVIVLNLIKKNKKGKGGCSCGCSGCPMSSTCGAKTEGEPKDE